MFSISRLLATIVAAGLIAGCADTGSSTGASETTAAGGDLAAWCLSWNNVSVNPSLSLEEVFTKELAKAEQEMLVVPPEILDAMTIHLGGIRDDYDRLKAAGWDDSAFEGEGDGIDGPPPEDDVFFNARNEMTDFYIQNCFAE